MGALLPENLEVAENNGIDLHFTENFIKFHIKLLYYFSLCLYWCIKMLFYNKILCKNLVCIIKTLIFAQIHSVAPRKGKLFVYPDPLVPYPTPDVFSISFRDLISSSWFKKPSPRVKLVL